MKQRYCIGLWGCDDITEFEMELTSEELELIKRMCELSEQTSTYGCMPTMRYELVGGE